MRKTVVVLVLGALLVSGCGTDGSGVRAGGDGERSERARLSTGEPTAVVVAVGDIACPPGATVTRRKCRQRATYRAAATLAPQRVITLGDEQYPRGSYHDFTHSYARSWGKLRRITWPVPGNHEYETPGARGYYRYFANRQPGRPGWYRRSLNGWQLYFLNSNCRKVDCEAQETWLRSQLAGHPSTCALIAMHHPRFSSGGEHGSVRGMRRFWRIAHQYGVDVALAGHDHDYERFAPMTPDGALDPAHGIQQFVSGGGGKSLYPKGTPVAGSKVFLSAFGVLKLSLRPNSYSWEFRGTRLRLRDSGSAACR